MWSNFGKKSSSALRKKIMKFGAHTTLRKPNSWLSVSRCALVDLATVIAKKRSRGGFRESTWSWSTTRVALIRIVSSNKRRSMSLDCFTYR